MYFVYVIEHIKIRRRERIEKLSEISSAIVFLKRIIDCWCLCRVGMKKNKHPKDTQSFLEARQDMYLRKSFNFKIFLQKKF